MDCGFIGRDTAGSHISYSTFSGYVQGIDYIGGFVGNADANLRIIGCVSSGNVIGNINIGGIIGSHSNAHI